MVATVTRATEGMARSMTRGRWYAHRRQLRRLYRAWLAEPLLLRAAPHFAPHEYPQEMRQTLDPPLCRLMVRMHWAAEPYPTTVRDRVGLAAEYGCHMCGPRGVLP